MLSIPRARIGGFFLATLVGGIAACSGGSTIGSVTDGGAGSTGTEGGSPSTVTDTSCSATYPVSQPMSAPCCPDRGADACGAGLFCAAFDGRTQSTCYPERSRPNGHTCTADVQCVSNTCDASGTCSDVTPDGGCTKPGGCGPTPDSGPPPKPGKCPSSCASNSDCQATCPAFPSGTQCCDLLTTTCYASNTPQCPK